MASAYQAQVECDAKSAAHFWLASLFDHLVGEQLQRVGHLNAQRPGGLEVDHQFELDGGLDGKLARLRASQDAIGILCCAPKHIERLLSVGKQPAEFSEVAERIDGGKTVASSQRYDLRAMAGQEDIRRDNKATIRLAGLRGNDRFELGNVVDWGGDRLHSEGRSRGFEDVQEIFDICRRCRVEQEG